MLLAGGGFGALLALLRLIGFTGEPPSTATAAAVTGWSPASRSAG